MTKLIKTNQLTPELYLKIYPFLKRGVNYLKDGTTIFSLINDFQTKEKQLWIIYEDDEPICCVITCFINYPHCKRLLYYLVTGKKISKCLTHHDEIVQYALYHGCKEIEIYGRKGWIKKLKAYGFKLDYIAMVSQI